MKLICATAERWSFRLSPTERAILMELLEAYPCVPPAHSRYRAVASGDPEGARVQQLLEEALAEQRETTRRQIRRWIRSSETLQQDGPGWVLHLRPAELETLLQVLNDVRVGQWIALGCPDPLPDDLPRDPDRAHRLATMELAGWFEMSLLQQIRHEPPA